MVCDRVLLGVLLGVLLVVAVSPADAEKPVGPRQGILAEPLDFSRPPTLPKLDAPTEEQIQTSIDRGVAFLLTVQNPNGSWGSATQTKGLNVYAPVPGAHHAFRAGTTSLCIAALAENESGNTEVGVALDRAETWLLKHLGSLRRATGDAMYNIWGHAYSIQALVRLRARRVADAAVVK